MRSRSLHELNFENIDLYEGHQNVHKVCLCNMMTFMHNLISFEPSDVNFLFV